MKKSTFLLFIGILITVSCGKDSKNEPKSPEVFEQQQEQQDLTGKYKAFLRPLNTSVSGFIPYGAAEIEVLNEEITVKTYLDDDSQVTHFQSIYSGTKCPSLSNDKNTDGIIDVLELESSSGQAVIPLDSDLSSQQNGQPIYPRGSSFTYSESAKLKDLLDDLYSTPSSAVTGFIKLREGVPLNLENKVVIVFGTGDITRIPETATSLNNQPRNLSVPVACGVLKKI